MSDNGQHFREDHIWEEGERKDLVIRISNGAIRLAVRVLAILMVLVIAWAVLDVVWEMGTRLLAPPRMLLDISDLLAIFGAFLACLIAIEIFINITLYLREDVIHVKLVVATALMAVARKVIVFDFKTLDSQYVWSTAVLVLAIGVTYWLIGGRARK